jgi:large subunit ribosomal protein L3
MKFILATKEDMSQIFAEDGRVVPVTILSAGPCVVTQVKNAEKDGYTALQLGFGTRAEKNISKPVKGHLKG